MNPISRFTAIGLLSLSFSAGAIAADHPSL